MKQFKFIFTLLVISILTFSCKNETKPEIKTVETAAPAKATKPALDPNATYAKAEFNIEGMTCQIGCANTIQKKLSNLEGIKSASVDFETELAMVEYDEAKVTPALLEETVTKAGEMYTVKNMKTVTDFNTACTCKADNEKGCCMNKDAEAKTACAEDCKMACCADKTADQTMSCATDGTKACCATKKA